MSTKMQVEWRRNKVLELLSKGDSQSDIAKTLQVDLSIISRDVYFLRQQAKSNIKRYIKIQALSLAKDCYSMKLDLLTNATVVDDAIRFVSDRSKDKEKMEASNSHDKEYSNKPNHDEYECRLEEKQEKETSEMTINQVF
jgi:hypothetical protein